MKATDTYFDIIVGYATGDVDGEELPDNVPVGRLRIVSTEDGGREVVDVEKHTEFFVDELGIKHVTQLAPEWQAVACRWDASLTLADGVWRVKNISEKLTPAKTRARAVVAELAERQRQRYITSGEGKAAVYLIKREEVLRFQANGGKPVVPTDFPWMNARASRLGVQLQVVAAEWGAKVLSWERVGRDIENAYEAAVEAIDALSNASTIETDVTRIVEGIRWP